MDPWRKWSVNDVLMGKQQHQPIKEQSMEI
jgi:hypothetical protein